VSLLRALVTTLKSTQPSPLQRRLTTARKWAGLVLGLLILAACGTSTEIQGLPTLAAVQATLTASPAPQPSATQPLPTQPPPTQPPPTQPQLTQAAPAGFTVQIDTQREVHAISPMIYGLASASDTTYATLQPGLVSWGGNPSTRYNWQIGHAWNTGQDYFYENTNYDYTGASASDDFIAVATAHNAEIRLAVPTLGWVAKNDSTQTCSFPLPGGGCGDGDGSSCNHPTQIADPKLANVRSDVTSIVAWMHHLFDQNANAVRFIAMDNEPELWGIKHYDVHPACTTYQEILDKYLTYASAIRAVAPKAELAGPVTCCWYYYWNSAAGEADKAKHGNADFLPWFLDQAHQHDLASGIRTLDVLDLHYYPEGLYNDDVDPATAAHRLRSTRSLWDPTYTDESWIATPIELIPRMKQIIDRWYPGTRLGLSEWNWGAEGNINGALAIADVLGILGREQVYYAAYWREPPPASPSFSAFRLYTNYDDHGDRFGDQSVWAQSDDVDTVGSYAALDGRTGQLFVMLVHKDPQTDLTVQLNLTGFKPKPAVQQYQLAQASGPAIVASSILIDANHPAVDLPAYSATLLVLAPQ